MGKLWEATPQVTDSVTENAALVKHTSNNKGRPQHGQTSESFLPRIGTPKFWSLGNGQSPVTLHCETAMVLLRFDLPVDFFEA